jgi:hypothetical protein
MGAMGGGKAPELEPAPEAVIHPETAPEAVAKGVDLEDFTREVVTPEQLRTQAQEEADALRRGGHHRQAENLEAFLKGKPEIAHPFLADFFGVQVGTDEESQAWARMKKAAQPKEAGGDQAAQAETETAKAPESAAAEPPSDGGVVLPGQRGEPVLGAAGEGKEAVGIHPDEMQGVLREAKFKDEAEARAAHEKDGLHEHGETMEEYLQRVLCQGRWKFGEV